MKWQIVQRVFLWLVIGIVLAVGINEISFFFMKSEAGRAPREVKLSIPVGTAEQVAHGEQSPLIPADMVFVVGDTLTIENLDVVDHTLGPLFIPSGSSASMTFSAASNFVYNCSFQSTNYFGLDVREPVTWGTRIYGIIFAGIPLGGLLALYSFLVWPLKPTEQAA